MEFKTKKYEFTSNSDYDISMLVKEETNEYLKAEVKIKMPKKETPKRTEICFSFPCVDVFSQWRPLDCFEKNLNPEWAPIRMSSRSASGAPVQTFLSLSGKNTLTVALSDVLTPIEILSGVREEDAKIYLKIAFFKDPISAISEYNAEIIIDSRKLPYYEVIYDIQKAWADYGYPSAPVPEYAKRPMYSTWYNWHQQLDTKVLKEELEIAKELGMDTVIVDDGWQTDDNNRGYAFCGDWEPAESKIPDMKKFVKEVHDIGMKYMMWYSVPYMGKNSKTWDKFSNMFLDGTDNDCSCLDPRYPKVREFLAELYENAVKEWDMDGLKLDFIDSFGLCDKSHKPNDDMDYESLEDAVCALLREVKERLMKIKPDIMIEFRQSYMGPLMRTYGNMIRVADCPDDALKNRVGSINLRMTSGKTAVHSDMIMWNNNETPEAAALQFINILFSVPQISARLKEIRKDHFDMLKFYLDFWNKNRDCILDGNFNAFDPQANFSLAYSENKNDIIAVSYCKNILELNKKYEKAVFINASWCDELLINEKYRGSDARIRIFDCLGNVLRDEIGKINLGYNSFKVPKSGMVEVLF